MKTLALIAVASALWALRAFAEDGPALTLAQFGVCIGRGCRYYEDYAWHCLHVDDWHYYNGGVCRDVTIRDLCGDGVARHVRLCD